MQICFSSGGFNLTVRSRGFSPVRKLSSLETKSSGTHAGFDKLSQRSLAELVEANEDVPCLAIYNLKWCYKAVAKALPMMPRSKKQTAVKLSAARRVVRPRLKWNIAGRLQAATTP